MVVADNDLLVDTNGTVVHLAHSDSAYIFVVVDGADQYLGTCLRVAAGSGDIIDDGLEERLHIRAKLIGVQGSDPGLCGGKYEGAVQLRIVSIQFQEQLQHFIHHFIWSGLGTIDLVDTYDDGEL